MKRSLRQDAEHRGPEVDLVLYRFSSGVCWRLPVPSAINKKIVTPPNPPPPTLIVGTPSQASVAVGRESGHLHTHTPMLSLLRVYAGRLSFLPFSTEEERHRKIHELRFFKDLSERSPFHSNSEINLHFKELLSSKQRDPCGHIVVHFTP